MMSPQLFRGQNERQARDYAKGLMLHELQHAIQKREGFASGGSQAEAGLDAYMRLAGEAEARAVQQRAWMSPEVRRQRYPLAGDKLENIPIDQLIIRR